MRKVIIGMLAAAGLCAAAHGQVTRNQLVYAAKTHDAAGIPIERSTPPGTLFDVGTRFTNFADVNRTPNGLSWYVIATTDAPQGSGALGANDQGLLRGVGLVGEILAREAVTQINPGGSTAEYVNFSISPFLVRMNDAGSWTSAFRLGIAGASTVDDRVVKFSNSTPVSVIKPGDPIPGTDGLTFAASGSTNTANLAFNSAMISNSGQLSFLAYFPGFPPTFDTAFKADGASVVVNPNDNSLIPTGQVGGATNPLIDITANTFQMNAAQTSYILQGLVGPSGGPGVAAAIVDGQVKAMIGGSVPTVATTAVTNVDGVRMESNGDWFVWGRVSTSPTIRFIMRNGVVIAETGQPIVPGSTELWGTTFGDPTGDGAGNWVVNGSTNEANSMLNAVLVYDSKRVIARKSDPIDMDGDGLYDDSLFFRSFRNRGTLAKDDFFYIATDIKAAADSNTGIGTSPNNSALLRVRVCRIDFDNNGVTNIDDIFIFLNAWFAGNPRTDFDLGGSVSIDDIFVYLNQWFAAGSVGC